jgi:hypothetical protein
MTRNSVCVFSLYMLDSLKYVPSENHSDLCGSLSSTWIMPPSLGGDHGSILREPTARIAVPFSVSQGKFSEV